MSEIEAKSSLSANTVSIDVISGRMEITFANADGDTTWGEGLDEIATLDVLNLLMAEASGHYNWGLAEQGRSAEGPR